MSNPLYSISGMFSTDRKSVRVTTTVLAVLLFAGFFLVAIGNAVQNPLCCKDDSYISTAAKNFATGHGYAVSFQRPAGGLRVFEPAITTGPTLVLPSAFFIKIFGNKFWITGLVTVFIDLFIFLLIYLLSVRSFGLIKANLFVSLLLGSFYLLSSPDFFYLWYTIIGEAAGIGFFIAGFIIFCFLRKNEQFLLFSMLLFGLAIITKLIYLLILFPVFLFFYFETLHTGGFNKKNIRFFILGMLVFALPHLLWELFKLSSLGFSGYLYSLKAMKKAYILLHGKSTIPSILEVYLKRKAFLNERIGLELNYFLLSIPVVFLIVRKVNLTKEQKLFSYLSIAGILLALFWWIFISRGWIRYAMPWLFMFFTILPFLIMAVNNYLIRVCLFLLLIFNLNIVKADSKPIQDVLELKLSYNERVENLQDLVNFLKLRSAETVLVSTWWGAYADIEYALPSSENFSRFNQLEEGVDYRKILLVRNTQYIHEVFLNDFQEFEKSFTDTVFFKSPYLVTKYSGSGTAEKKRD